MMNRILIFCVLMMLISSCSGMNSKRSQKSDEFLIQKKNPLVMPPDIDDLHKPKEEGVVEEKNDFKDALGSKKVEDQRSRKDQLRSKDHRSKITSDQEIKDQSSTETKRSKFN